MLIDIHMKGHNLCDFPSVLKLKIEKTIVSVDHLSAIHFTTFNINKKLI